jgi:hypothetical protein
LKASDGNWYYNHRVEARSLRPTDSGGAIGGADLGTSTTPARTKSGAGSGFDIHDSGKPDN